jgi:hypothetical protein
MPPRKPKQPARKKSPAKKTSQKQETPSFNPDTHLLGADGKVYERKIVSGTGSVVGLTAAGGEKTDSHLELERKMGEAILRAHQEGHGNNPEEIRRFMQAAIDDHKKD